MRKDFMNRVCKSTIKAIREGNEKLRTKDKPSTSRPTVKPVATKGISRVIKKDNIEVTVELKIHYEDVLMLQSLRDYLYEILNNETEDRIGTELLSLNCIINQLEEVTEN